MDLLDVIAPAVPVFAPLIAFMLIPLWIPLIAVAAGAVMDRWSGRAQRNQVTRTRLPASSANASQLSAS